MSTILAIDPGPVASAYVAMDTKTLCVLTKDIMANERLVCELRDPTGGAWLVMGQYDHLVCERIIPYGTAVAQVTFDACHWTGRLVEAAWPTPHTLIDRKAIMLHLLGRRNGTESQVNAALCDRYGVDMRGAKGTKKHPGPLHGFRTHLWAALAVAVTFAETRADLLHEVCGR